MADVWKSQPRKYCEVCKCWLADNKVSREFHENGTRHKAAVQRKINELHFKESEKMKDEKDLKAHMDLMNAAAYQGMIKDIAKDPKKMSIYGVQVNDQTKNDIKKQLFNMPSEHLSQQQNKFQPNEIKKSPWRAARTKEGLIYYWNTLTKESTWEKPVDYIDEPKDNIKTTLEGKRNIIDDTGNIVKRSRIVFNNAKNELHCNQPAENINKKIN